MKKIPKYQQVANALREEIQSNMQLNDRIPVEDELEKRYKVSRITIRQAVTTLIEEGWLSRQQGRGTFVSRENSGNSQSGLQKISLLSRFAIGSGLQVPYFTQILDGIRKECDDLNIQLSVLLFEPSDKDLLQRIQHSQCDATLLLASLHKHQMENLANSNKPIVGVCNFTPNPHFDCINNEDAGGGLKGIKYLYDKGNRNIAVLCDPSNKGGMGQRLAGVEQAQLLHNLNDIQQTLIYGDSKKIDPVEYGFQVVNEYLNKTKIKPDAIFALSDQYAIGAMSALEHNDLSCPGDVAILGYENIDMSKFTSPTLSTISVDMEKIGRASVRRLIQRVQNPDLPITEIRIENEILDRNSLSK